MHMFKEYYTNIDAREYRQVGITISNCKLSLKVLMIYGTHLS